MMTPVRKSVLAATIVGSMLAGGVGAWMFAPGAGGAATTGTTSPASGSSGSSGSASGQCHWNEDPAHEKAESAQREAQENSGQFSPAG